jgi:hypothetical protein
MHKDLGDIFYLNFCGIKIAVIGGTENVKECLNMGDFGDRRENVFCLSMNNACLAHEALKLFYDLSVTALLRSIYFKCLTFHILQNATEIYFLAHC